MYNLYLLTSSLDNKIYIGITNNPERRYYEHINYTVEKTYYNGNWIRKTLQNGGKIKMTILLSDISKKKAIELEIEMIKMFKKIAPEYCTNTAQGGLGFNHKGIPHSEEHKRNIEKAQPHKVRIPYDELYSLYINRGFSKADIGKMYGCGATTIDRRLYEYGIEIRKTKNYKISYSLDKNKIIDMFLNKRINLTKIAKTFKVKHNVIRDLLIREGIDTGINKHVNKTDISEVINMYEKLRKDGIKKMKAYSIISDKFNLCKGYVAKLNLNYYSNINKNK